MQDDTYPFKILFVEDEKAIRDTYVEYLKMFFDEVYEAADGEEAYLMYKQKKPHIMIVDIHLPKMNGIELLKKIRITDQETKAIMLTAHTDTSFLLDASSLKLTKYLVKPITRKELQDALDLVVTELNNFRFIPLKTINLKENYHWNYELQELKCSNKIVKLTKKEKEVFILFISNINKVLTYDKIIYEAWIDEDIGTRQTLKTTIKTLRKKLPLDSIENIFGVGYKINI